MSNTVVKKTAHTHKFQLYMCVCVKVLQFLITICVSFGFWLIFCLIFVFCFFVYFSRLWRKQYEKKNTHRTSHRSWIQTFIHSSRMNPHNKTNNGWSSKTLLIVMLNVVAFIVCLCAIFLPSMPHEHGNIIYLERWINDTRLLIRRSFAWYIFLLFSCFYLYLSISVSVFFPLSPSLLLRTRLLLL